MNDKTLSEVIAELEEKLNNGTYLTFIPSDFMQIISTLVKREELLREALLSAEWKGYRDIPDALDEHFYCPICLAHSSDSSAIPHDEECSLFKALSLTDPS